MAYNETPTKGTTMSSIKHVPVYSEETKPNRVTFKGVVKKAVKFADNNPKVAIALMISVPQAVGYSALALLTKP